MVRWFRLFSDQYLGFWITGAVLFVLQEVPYMVMPLVKMADNPIMNMPESSMILEILEKVTGSLCIAAMIFCVSENAPFFGIGEGMRRIGFAGAVIVLLLNYTGWILYFNGHQSTWIILFFLVLMPPLYYVFIGLWRNNRILLPIGLVFALIHFAHVYLNLKK